MATASPEASEVRRRGRQRLIGAIIIAVLLVVFVPMILDSEPRPAREQPALEIPRKDTAPPLPSPPPPKVTSPAGPAGPTADVTPAKAGAQSPPPAPEPAKAAPVAKAAGAKAKGAAVPPKLEGFAVQVGAFREEDKLKQARDKLTAAGLAHYTERLATSSGDLTRLRAGPFATREAAENALAAIKAAALDGKVVPLP
jgi:DedD protein